jgi:predicted transcriptional regulator of viral defense system
MTKRAKEQIYPLLLASLEDLEASIDVSNTHVWLTRQLKQFLRSIKALDPIFNLTMLTIEDIISFLIEKSHLRKIKFQTPRTETLYIWREVNKYELIPVLRPNGYYTHLSAMYFHGLIDYEPDNIFFNHEQIARPIAGSLEQGRIDNAFQKKQRITTARTKYGDKEYWLLNGKQTGNYGVILMEILSAIKIPVTDLERTLIDITVRPAYAGGVNSVLNAYLIAESKVSIDKIKKTLRSLNFVYPYYQSIGFYIDLAGNYSDEAMQKLLDHETFQYDFYLDYEMKNPIYSERWRLYYPQSLNRSNH